MSVKIVSILLFEITVIFILKLNDMNIVSNDKIELKYDKYEKNYTLTVYDKYGHYIDDVILNREEVKELYEGLDSIKNTF